MQQLYILTQSIITHYSSTIFHYIHLNNPLFILQQHHQQYKQTLPFYFHFFELPHFLKPSLNQHILPKQISTTHYINYSKLLHPFIKQHTSKTTEKLIPQILPQPQYPTSSNSKQHIS
ncbi:CDP-glycerol glycerophosphotransferase family protein [Staphylococcus epidermidis]|uniref:CDP-glycerol glycerophosphotransferase family protein n=1 Tax=Staphylococcus epidermidis TaxID=1282 RepID=UPI0021B1F806|nr:CDP-glycerol glycerophosphotransferase family protein [Staphylococcus epidermidis]